MFWAPGQNEDLLPLWITVVKDIALMMSEEPWAPELTSDQRMVSLSFSLGRSIEYVNIVYIYSIYYILYLYN